MRACLPSAGIRADFVLPLRREGSGIMLYEIRKNTVDESSRVWLSAPLEVPFGRGINFEI